MTQRIFTGGARVAALTLAAAGAIALAGCEQHGYASSAPTAAPAEAEAPLAGAPTTRSPEYVGPPPGGYAPGYPPPAGPYAQAPNPYGPPPPPAYGSAPSGPPEVVTMAPIPNPPERPHGMRRHYRHARRYAYGPAYAPAAGYAPHRHHHHHRHLGMAPPAYAAPAVRHHHARAAAPAAPVHAAAPMRHPAPAPSHAAPEPAAPAGAQLPKPAAPDHRKHHHATAAAAAGTAATAAAASGGPTKSAEAANTTANTTASGSEADRYHALEQSLKDAFGSAAELKAPAHMDAGQGATVTLTLPGDFAQTVRAEAAKQNLSDAAMTVNLTATLTGDGFQIVPDQPQTMPLTLDTPTNFTWKVSPNGAGRGALKAAVRAQMVGDGHDLDLGSKSTGLGARTGRLFGIGLLAVIALILIGWAAQRRRPRPAPIGATKPRVANFDPNPRA